MSFIDKLVNSVRLNDSYDDQEEFLEDEDIEEEEEDRRSFADRWREKREARKERKRSERAVRQREADDAAYETNEEPPTYSFREDTEEPEEEPARESSPGTRSKSRWKRRGSERRGREESSRWDTDTEGYTSEEPAYEKSYESSPRPRFTPMRSRKAGQVPMEVKVIRPTSMEDSREIADTLISECTVLLNLEGIDMDVAQRIIDFTCGTCYSLKGRLQKISNYIFILTPEEVDISGDVISMLGGNFDIPTMRSEY